MQRSNSRQLKLIFALSKQGELKQQKINAHTQSQHKKPVKTWHFRYCLVFGNFKEFSWFLFFRFLKIF